VASEVKKKIKMDFYRREREGQEFTRRKLRVNSASLVLCGKFSREKTPILI